MSCPRTLYIAMMGAVLTGCASAPAAPRDSGAFEVVEASIADIHAAMREGRLTSVELVRAYMARIEAYDRKGPAINAIIEVNANALKRAGELDAELARTGSLSGPLHGIPIIVKDNYDTSDLATTAGSRTMSGALAPDDAFMVKKLRVAGAIVLAKSNMAEFAFSPYETVGSTLAGYTFNPYALNRVPAGSSGGTAAAVAASFGTVGLGTDTGNSIRGPSSHTSLVGIRPTMGLTSRDGIVPLYLERDVGGPMARSVEDAARVLDVVAGIDAADTATLNARGHIPATYTASLDRGALRGARIGVVRRFTTARTADPGVVARFDGALEELRREGAVLIDSLPMIVLDSVRPSLCSSFKADLEDYLKTRPGLPQTLLAIIDSRRYHVTIERSLMSQSRDSTARTAERCTAAARSKQRFQDGLRAVLREHNLDALVYPTWSNPPRLIGDLTSPHGDNNQVLSPASGFPAITVPMGFVSGNLPVGLQFLGDAWSEPRLIGLAYAYEQATRHRRAPTTTPALAATMAK